MTGQTSLYKGIPKVGYAENDPTGNYFFVNSVYLLHNIVANIQSCGQIYQILNKILIRHLYPTNGKPVPIQQKLSLIAPQIYLINKSRISRNQNICYYYFASLFQCNSAFITKTRSALQTQHFPGSIRTSLNFTRGWPWTAQHQLNVS